MVIPRAFRRFWLRNWGFTLFTALSLLAAVRLLLQDVPGHYRVFTGAASNIANGLNPYGTDFGTRVGYYFYSPSCALYVFRWFGWFPEKWGLSLYMGISWVVFVLGVGMLVRAHGQATGRKLKPELVQWFWIGIAPQMLGGILASKLEILISGVLLISISLLLGMKLEGIKGRGNTTKLASSAFLLAMVTNWKFQPLPVAGLVSLAVVSTSFLGSGRHRWKNAAAWAEGLSWPGLFVFFLGLWYALPLVEKPAAFLREIQTIWSQTFSDFVRASFGNFENGFAFLRNSLGLEISYETARGMIAVSGGGLAAFQLAWAIRIGQRLSVKEAWPEALLLALTMGTTFMTVLSPLGQNNALILYAPLLLAGFIRLGQAEGEKSQVRWKLLLCLVWAVMTLSYSDLVPFIFRAKLRHLVIKPLACLTLGVALGASAFFKIRSGK